MLSKVRSALRAVESKGLKGLARTGAVSIASRTAPGEQLLYRKSLAAITERIDVEEGLEDILDTVLEIKPGYPPYQLRAAQVREELQTVAEIVRAEEPQTVLEIGTHDGGTLYTWARYFSAEEFVSLDLPDGDFGGGYSEKKSTIYRNFNEDAKMSFVRRNSHDPETLEIVADTLDEDVDFLFIDGDHTYEGVKQDFEMYSELCGDDATIALHDIATHPDDEAEVERRRREVDDIDPSKLVWGDIFPQCNVDDFWAELAEEYETTEIVSHPEQTWGGIGMISL